MYHYTACGLDNVWLTNGYAVKETAYGKGVSIEEVDGLHEVLAIDVANKAGRLSGKELRFLRTMLCMSQQGLAKVLGVTEQAVSLWERTGKVPKASDAVVRMCILEKLNGNGKVTEVIERINTVERLVNQKIIAKASRHKWTAKAKAAEKAEAVFA